MDGTASIKLAADCADLCVPANHTLGQKEGTVVRFVLAEVAARSSQSKRRPPAPRDQIERRK